MGQGMEAGKGAVGGALSGAAMGSAIAPGVGTLVGAGAGALLGGIGGWFGGNDQEDQYNKRLTDYYNQLANRQAPQAGPAAQGGYSNFRTQQGQMINRLDAMSRGQGPSLAAQQFQQATDRNMASQQAMANSGRGGAMGAFNAANNMGMLGAQAAQGSAAARTNEMNQAYQQLGISLYGARNADEEMNRFNAGQQNQTMLANLDARLKAMGLNDQARLQLLQQMGGQANKPSFGDQLLAGGAGAFSMGAGMMGGQKKPMTWSNGQGSAYGLSGYQAPGPSFLSYGGPSNPMSSIGQMDQGNATAMGLMGR